MTLFSKILATWRSIPAQLAKENKKFQYKTIKTGARANIYAPTLDWLVTAGLIHKCVRVNEPSCPLSAFADNEAFKVYMMDTGLLCSKFDIAPQLILNTEHILDSYKGALAENYVIPKLAKPVRKYFEMRQYRVRDVVEPFSGILEELNSFDIIWIDRKSTDTFAVSYYKTVALNPQASVLEQRFDILDSKTLELDTKAKEKLEVALMESPQVYAVDLEVETLGKVEGILKYIPQEEQVLAQMQQSGSAR